MSEIVERGVQAVEARGMAPDADGDWRDLPLEKIVRAVIEAMREPTETMLEPATATYLGRRLDEMSREELIQAVISLGEWNRTLCDGAQQDRKMFGRIMKSARP